MKLLHLAVLLWALTGCSLFHQDQANEAPSVQLSEASPRQINRSGRVELRVLADDEDDDPLFYTWSAFGSGSFTDSTQASTTWIAPDQIEGDSQRFLLTITVRDRDCASVVDLSGYGLCLEQASSVVDTFWVEVVQRPPTLQVTEDTTASFSTAQIVLLAQGNDADDDPLSYAWQQISGEEVALQPGPAPEGSQLSFVALFPGEYRFAVSVADGADSVSAQIRVQVESPPAPEGGMVDLTLTDGHTYQIDIFEYPNQAGTLPHLVDTWFEAAQLCAAQAKRLCTQLEWNAACLGPEERNYSSTDDPNRFAQGASLGWRLCNGPNSAAEGQLVSSGAFPNCVSASGVYDMSGNAGEWLANLNSSGAIEATLSLSDFLVGGDCGTFAVPFPPLPADFDVESTAAIDELNSQSLDHAPYFNSGRGFRCCR